MEAKQTSGEAETLLREILETLKQIQKDQQELREVVASAKVGPFGIGAFKVKLT